MLINSLSPPAGESNSQMVSLSDELSQKNEELLRHQEEIAQLLSQIVELQHRVKEVRLPPPSVQEGECHVKHWVSPTAGPGEGGA